MKSPKNPPTPMEARLAARWSSPDEGQRQALGAALWADLMATPVRSLAPDPVLEAVVLRVTEEAVIREIHRLIDRGLVEGELVKLRDSGEVLLDLVGEEGAQRLRRLVVRPPELDRELMQRLLDQPLLRQALRETLAATLTSFFEQLGDVLPFNKATVGPTGGMARGVLGELGRGLAKKAVDTARIGKTWAEGLGVGRAFEEQIQPFLASYAQRAMRGLLDNLFSGERAELAAEARLNVLETLLESPLSELLPAPDLAVIDLRIRAGEAVWVHAAQREGQRETLVAFLRSGRDKLGEGTVGALFTRLGLSLEAEPALLEVLGKIGHEALARPAFRAWLAAEIASVADG